MVLPLCEGELQPTAIAVVHCTVNHPMLHYSMHLLFREGGGGGRGQEEGGGTRKENKGKRLGRKGKRKEGGGGKGRRNPPQTIEEHLSP